MQIKWAPWLMLLALSAGCTTLNEKQCRTTDWREQGRSDGADGYESTRLGDHGEACGRYGIVPDADAYRAGRDEGLQQYCTLDNAMQQGLKGAPYHQVCAGETGEQFAVIYARGKALKLIRDDMQAVQDRLGRERDARAKASDADLQQRMEQNLRYFERENVFMQRQYEQAMFAVRSGFDPPFYDEGGWKAGIPFPKTLREAGYKK